MSSLGYVLCKWKSQFWPAKVLSKDTKQTKNSKMDVEILCLDELIHVKYKDTKPLVKVEVENIAAELASKSKNTPVEELTYRKALRIALDILNEAPTAVSLVDNHCNSETNNTSSKDTVFKEMEKNIGKNINQNSSCTTNRRKNPLENKRKRLTQKPDKMEHCVADSTEDISLSPMLHETNPALNSLRKEHDSSFGATSSIKKSPDIKRMRSLKTNRDTGAATPQDTEELRVSKSPQENFDSSSTSPKCMGAAKNGEPRNTNGKIKKGTGKLNVQNKKHGLRTCYPTRLTHTSRDLSLQTSLETESGIKCKNHPIQDKQDFSPELSSSDMELNSPTGAVHDAMLPEEGDPDVELPSFLRQSDPVSFEPGMFVWCKYQKIPYWPSLVKTIRRKDHKASVLYVDETLADPNNKAKGFSVSLRNLKHYDCKEKQQLLEKARECYGNAVDWCNEMIKDYCIRMGCASFSGSFVEYCTADISYPVRRELQFGKSRLFFPAVDTESEDSQTEATPSKSHPGRKLLPDRARAARDRANERLVDFIVKTKQAENHLMDILAGRKKSHWLHDFQVADRHMTCIETYLEDEEQVEYVVTYLQNVCEQMGCAAQRLMNKDPAAFIMDVLLPEGKKLV
ncbi:hypothetical protein XENTR_v10001286 [Xenopus tropicalis]|uniref:PWWP domain-containing DNA repair factor 3A isoform X2 n=1 Tax=Xenopus tropicalis TaxID=8364 RepID=A0A8J0QTE4_XENTR|nr:PWWP domain-containing DNA repair factor 3A isoform X2 [Xenopus tropicalis]KAE8631717.1 hypothetical protein XENTR_v10001286 [Xenopus tropicalis]